MDACAIVTGPAVGIVAGLHNRIPLILRPEQIAAWLDPTTNDAMRFLAGNDVELEAFPVSPLVNSPANEGPELIEPDPKSGCRRDGLPLLTLPGFGWLGSGV